MTPADTQTKHIKGHTNHAHTMSRRYFLAFSPLSDGMQSRKLWNESLIWSLRLRSNALWWARLSKGPSYTGGNKVHDHTRVHGGGGSRMAAFTDRLSPAHLETVWNSVAFHVDLPVLAHGGPSLKVQKRRTLFSPAPRPSTSVNNYTAITWAAIITGAAGSIINFSLLSKFWT